MNAVQDFDIAILSVCHAVTAKCIVKILSLDSPIRLECSFMGTRVFLMWI